MAVDDEVLAALDSMSLAELRYRAEVVTALSWTENASNAHPLITFQHDCALNFAGPTCGAELQEIFYQGVPEDLQRLAADRTPVHENNRSLSPGSRGRECPDGKPCNRL